MGTAAIVAFGKNALALGQVHFWYNIFDINKKLTGGALSVYIVGEQSADLEKYLQYLKTVERN